jgi:hypothetical protein
MMEIAPRLVPVFWSALGVAGLSGIVFFIGITMMLGAQRPVVLRVIWVSASLLVASGTAVIVILSHR